jgi:hypothetical protein
MIEARGEKDQAWLRRRGFAVSVFAPANCDAIGSQGAEERSTHRNLKVLSFGRWRVFRNHAPTGHGSIGVDATSRIPSPSIYLRVCASREGQESGIATVPIVREAPTDDLPVSSQGTGDVLRSRDLHKAS